MDLPRSLLFSQPVCAFRFFSQAPQNEAANFLYDPSIVVPGWGGTGCADPGVERCRAVSSGHALGAGLSAGFIAGRLGIDPGSLEAKVGIVRSPDRCTGPRSGGGGAASCRRSGPKGKAASCHTAS